MNEEVLKKNDAILFLDSGVGGISVLREAIKILPNENFIFFGDSKNAPYGDKDADVLLDITLSNIEKLISKKLKAIVIACNTITGVAISELREKYQNIDIIGVEPAVKPAVIENPNKDIWVMATERTLKEEKFDQLLKNYGQNNHIENIACTGLMEFIEEGIFEGEELENFLKSLFNNKEIEKAGAVVLGCTHYPFVAHTIKKVTNYKLKIYDGSKGTANRLKEILAMKDLLSNSTKKGSIEIISSNNNSNMIELAKKLMTEN